MRERDATFKDRLKAVGDKVKSLISSGDIGEKEGEKILHITKRQVKNASHRRHTNRGLRRALNRNLNRDLPLMG